MSAAVGTYIISAAITAAWLLMWPLAVLHSRYMERPDYDKDNE